MEKDMRFAAMFVIGAVLIIILYGVGEKEKSADVLNDQTGVDVVSREWSVYEDVEYGFQIHYPSNWDVRESVVPQGWQKRIVFIPKDLTPFPVCQSEENMLIENYQQYYDEAMEDSVRGAYEARSCGISVGVEDNPNHLSLIAFFEGVFAQSRAHDTSITDEEVLNFIASLEVMRKGGEEYAVSDTSFYYMGGFGEKEGVEEVFLPALMHGEDQYIAITEDVVLFINNDMHKADSSLSHNRDIYHSMIESLEFLVNENNN